MAVARASGVAPSTVSRILNDSRSVLKVRPETRQRVVETARRLGYRPNNMARILRAQRTNAVGVIGMGAWMLSEPTVDGEAIRAALEVLEEQGDYFCSTFISSNLAKRFNLPNWRVDGLIVQGPTQPDDWVHAEVSGLPYVTINGYGGAKGCSMVYDEHLGMRLALEHLLSLGHRRIGYLDWMEDRSPHYSRTQRLAAYQSLMNHHGLVATVAASRTFEDTSQVVRAMLAQQHVTAVICYSHTCGMQLLNAAHSMDIKIPQRLSVICFNDMDLLNMTAPAMSAIRLPAEQMGRKAAEFLLSMMRQDPGWQQLPGSTHLLPEMLTLRASTGAPP
jgi:DNA-binding LacI/PurR family transcriptional regulator